MNNQYFSGTEEILRFAENDDDIIF